MSQYMTDYVETLNKLNEAKIKRIGELERENYALRQAAVEVCAIGRVWITVWGDKLSPDSIRRFDDLEQRILKEAQP